MKKTRKKAALILADGTVYSGYSFGAQGTSFGELVFTTGVSGFQETLTDPSNFGQIVVQTFASVGGYGVNADDFASDRCHLSGYVVRELTELPSNYKMTGDLEGFVEQHGVAGICGVDTRAITRHIRDNGSMNAAITTEYFTAEPELLEKIRSFRIASAVEQVLPKQIKVYEAKDAVRQVLAVDFGCRNATIANLNAHGCTVTAAPVTLGAEALLKLAEQADGIVFSEGPGSPEDSACYLDTVRQLAHSGKAVLALGLGHQLLAMAEGAQCQKLPRGHRGANQPVKHLKSGNVYVTTQNHGYAVQADTLPSQAGEVVEVSLNDGCCEGIVYTSIPALSLIHI